MIPVFIVEIIKKTDWRSALQGRKEVAVWVLVALSIWTSNKVDDAVKYSKSAKIKTAAVAKTTDLLQNDIAYIKESVKANHDNVTQIETTVQNHESRISRFEGIQYGPELKTLPLR